MNPAVWDIIAALVSVSIVLGILAICIGRTEFRAGPRRLWFWRWTRVCMCAHGRLAHADGRSCRRCSCWQWRPFLARRRQSPDEPPPLPRRVPAPGLPHDGEPLDDYYEERWRRAIRAYNMLPESEVDR